MESGLVQLQLEDGVGLLTIDSPPVNALTVPVLENLAELTAYLNELPATELRAVIITGAGQKVFVAGANVKDFPRLIAERRASENTRLIHRVFNAIESLPVPVIAAVNGMALGGGAELALACDLRLSSSTSTFGFPEVNLGLFPAGGGTQRLPKIIGEAKAKLLMFTGQSISAAEALRIGLVDEVVEAEQLIERAKKLAVTLSNKAGLAVRAIKELITQGRTLPLDEGLRLEADYIDRIFNTVDVSEGVAAFLAKRQPLFRHR